MATKLFLRNTTTNGITDTGDGIVYDMVTTAGAAADTADTVTVAGGTQVQATKDIVANLTVAWISGRVPAGGFTLTNTDISMWQRENNMNANLGGRYRVFRYQPGSPPTITELGAGPFDDGVEMNTSDREDLWPGNVADTAFVEDDRILLRYYATNIGTMGNQGWVATFNAADASTGDSFFNIAETVTFKAEPSPDFPINAEPGAYSATGAAATIVADRVSSADPGSYSISGVAAGVVAGRAISADPGSYALSGVAAGLVGPAFLAADPGAYAITGAPADLIAAYILSADPGSYSLSGVAAGPIADRVLSADPGGYTLSGIVAGLLKGGSGTGFKPKCNDVMLASGMALRL